MTILIANLVMLFPYLKPWNGFPLPLDKSRNLFILLMLLFYALVSTSLHRASSQSELLCESWGSLLQAGCWLGSSVYLCWAPSHIFVSDDWGWAQLGDGFRLQDLQAGPVLLFLSLLFPQVSWTYYFLRNGRGIRKPARLDKCMLIF